MLKDQQHMQAWECHNEPISLYCSQNQLREKSNKTTFENSAPPKGKGTAVKCREEGDIFHLCATL